MDTLQNAWTDLQRLIQTGIELEKPQSTTATRRHSFHAENNEQEVYLLEEAHTRLHGNCQRYDIEFQELLNAQMRERQRQTLLGELLFTRKRPRGCRGGRRKYHAEMIEMSDLEL